MMQKKQVVLVLLLLSAVFAHSGEATLILSNTSGALGSRDNVMQVFMKNDVDVKSLQLAIADIPDYLKPDSIWTTERTKNFTVSGYDDTTGAFNIILVSFDPSLFITPDSGAILNISYSVHPVAGQYNSLDLVFYMPPIVVDRNYEKIPTVTLAGKFTIGETGVVSNSGMAPEHYTLKQNHPNPFNPTTVISFTLPRNEATSLTIYNVLGQRIRTLVDAEFKVGAHEVIWDGLDETGEPVAAGVYIYRLQAGSFTASKRMAYMR